MIRNRIAALIILGALTAYAQKPAAPPQAQTQKVDPAKPAEIHVEQKTATPEQAKALRDQLNLFQLDQLAVQTAEQTFSQTDPVAKKAIEIYKNAVSASPEVQKANAQLETDRKALLAKIDDLRKQQGLDSTWDWDFNTGRFAQTKPSPAAAAVKK